MESSVYIDVKDDRYHYNELIIIWDSVSVNRFSAGVVDMTMAQ